MSIGVCRVQKITAPKDIAGIQIHNRRERTHSNTNPDIDHDKSKDNYAMTVKSNQHGLQITTMRSNPSGKPYNELIDERIKQGYKGKKAVRKDAVRLCEVLFTASGDFFDQHPEQTKAFFTACVAFAANRFGAENIIAATVHMDEETPHMHLDFVPLTSDGRLSAKSVLGGRKDMQQLQDEFYEQVGKQFGLERGSRADLDSPDEGERPRKHLTTRELKAETAAQIAEQERKIDEYDKEIEHLESLIRGYMEQSDSLSAQLGELEAATSQAVLTANEAEQTALLAEDRAEQAVTRRNNAEQQLAEINAKYEVAIKELAAVLDKKARAAEIHKLGNLFGETVQYHKNMLESTRAIGNEAYERLQKALKALEEAKALEARTKSLQEQIEPLHQQAQADKDTAARLRKEQEQLIEKRAAELTSKRISAMFGDAPDSRRERLERFCAGLRFKDGSTALDAFNEQEKQLRAKGKKINR